ncbi:MAG: RNA-binding protein [Chlamydiae bacterium]|nr:RNA-binding protein [Chlamydiota bacterium]
MTQKKLYVGSLPYKVTESQLHDLFSSIGEVASLRIITDKMNGQSKGFAFVEMATAEGAEKALAELNGMEWEGRKLIVSEAREPQGQGRRGGGGGFRKPHQRGGGRREGREGGFRSSYPRSNYSE